VLKHHYSYLHLCHPAPPNCLLSVFLVKKMVDGCITVGHKSPSCVTHVLLNVSQPCNSSVQVNSSHCVLIMCKPFLLTSVHKQGSIHEFLLCQHDHDYA